MKRILLALVLISNFSFVSEALAQEVTGCTQVEVKWGIPDPDKKEVGGWVEKGKGNWDNLKKKDAVQRFKTGEKYVRYCVEFQEAIPLGAKEIRSVSGDSGVEMVSNYIGLIYRFGAAIIGFICVLVIVISGIQITAGGASPDAVTQGKTRILQALLSLILLFASAMILQTVNPGFFTLF